MAPRVTRSPTSIAEDAIALDHAGFGIAGTGTLASHGVDFVYGNVAASSDPTVIFRPFANELWWDADGPGSGAAQLCLRHQPTGRRRPVSPPPPSRTHAQAPASTATARHGSPCARRDRCCASWRETA